MCNFVGLFASHYAYNLNFRTQIIIIKPIRVRTKTIDRFSTRLIFQMQIIILYFSLYISININYINLFIQTNYKNSVLFFFLHLKIKNRLTLFLHVILYSSERFYLYIIIKFKN